MKKILILMGLVLLVCGCDGRKCIKSHTEQSVCTSTIYNGKTVTPITIPCSVTVCDEYEVGEDETKNN